MLIDLSLLLLMCLIGYRSEKQFKKLNKTVTALQDRMGRLYKK